MVDMSRFGKRWVCYNCGTKFYDFNKEKPICPKCGIDVSIDEEEFDELEELEEIEEVEEETTGDIDDIEIIEGVETTVMPEEDEDEDES